MNASRLTLIHNAACSQQSQLYSSIKGFFSAVKLPLIWHFCIDWLTFPSICVQQVGQRSMPDVRKNYTYVVIYFHSSPYSSVLVHSNGSRRTPFLWTFDLKRQTNISMFTLNHSRTSRPIALAFRIPKSPVDMCSLKVNRPHGLRCISGMEWPRQSSGANGRVQSKPAVVTWALLTHSVTGQARETHDSTIDCSRTALTPHCSA